jgi:broad specificity polyphosphatase/5'/3'-nucleotidase SurE
VSDLEGYRIYYASSSPITSSNSDVVTISTGTTAAALSNLTPGTYYVAVSAVYNNGTESEPTEEITALVN